MVDPNESRLVELAQTGDKDAFTELYRQNRRQIVAVGCEIYRGPGSETDLEDFCSDVCLLAFKDLNDFRGEAAFGTWLVTVARNKVKAILRGRAQPKNGDDRLAYQGSDTSDEQWERECCVAEDGRLDATAAKQDVDRLTQILSPANRELVQLHHLDGLTETEIASRTGLSVPAIRGRLSRAMVQLRKKVKKVRIEMPLKSP